MSYCIGRTYVKAVVVLAIAASLAAGPVLAQDKEAGTPGNKQTEIKNETPAKIDESEKMEGNGQIASESGPDETIEKTSLFSTVRQGGPIMIFIIILGLVSMTIIIERLIFFTRSGIWKRDGVESMLKTARSGSRAQYREDLEDEMRAVFQVYANDCERGLALLSGVGNLAPIVGFLGTVIGMISAFAAIAAATTVNAKVVAVGIQMALVTTAGGLVVAAPTLFFYYLFTNVIQSSYAKSEEYISRLGGGLQRLSDSLPDSE